MVETAAIDPNDSLHACTVTTATAVPRVQVLKKYPIPNPQIIQESIKPYLYHRTGNYHLHHHTENYTFTCNKRLKKVHACPATEPIPILVHFSSPFLQEWASPHAAAPEADTPLLHSSAPEETLQAGIGDEKDDSLENI